MSSSLKDSAGNAGQVHKLVEHILGSRDPELLSSHFRSTLRLLNASKSHEGEFDKSELEVVDSIKKILAGNEEKLAKFSSAYIKLRRSRVLKNYKSVLSLLIALRNTEEDGKQSPAGHFPIPRKEKQVSGKPLKTTLRISQKPPPLPPKPEILPMKSSSSSSAYPLKELIRELIFVFQGIEGKIIVRDPEEDSYVIRPELRSKYSEPTQHCVRRLGELGWLFNKLHKFCESQDSLNVNGLIGQSYVGALKEELTEYYRLLSVLEAQGESLSLSQLRVWTYEPFERMKFLAQMVDTCRDTKGGALISSIYSFVHHGNPALSSAAKSILISVCRPIYVMLLKWVGDGILEDPFNEFFIAANPKVTSDFLWEDKYSIRLSVIPKFMSLNWVKKILATGKSINYLREVCLDSSPISGRNVIKKNLDMTTPENLFQDPHGNLLHSAIQRVYTDTSNAVLSVLFTRYKFLDHVTAMRKYLLLGQGDVIRYLLELLESELDKPASSLYPHNLSGILETAVRATNAQFEDPDILDRLDVRLLEIQPGDTGWDVFSLDYKVHGPIGTVFRPNTMTSYLMLFNALWRAKRMEWLLSFVWKRQISLHKIANQIIPELVPLLYRADLLCSEMVHFIHQMAYYITFEAMECSWDQLITHLRQAESLDEIIDAHEQFLKTLLMRALLDENSREVLTQLRAIYDRIIEFQNIQNKLYALAVAESEARRVFAERMERNTERGGYGVTAQEEDDYAQQRKNFSKMTLGDMKAQLKIVSQSYQDMVRTFLLQLTCSQDPNLRFLSVRIDFNSHYKRTDARLGTPLTFQHRRTSFADFPPVE